MVLTFALNSSPMWHVPTTRLLLLGLLLITCRSKQEIVNSGNMADTRWSEVDSMHQVGRFASALKRTEELMVEARASADWRNEYRAWHYRAALTPMIGGSIDSALLAMEARATVAPVPLKQLLHSAVAEGWWQRYQDDRWSIMERTGTDAPNADPGTWTQRMFMEKVITHYQASLEPADTLLQLPIGDLGPLVDSAGRSMELRPTVYDVLAHRALEVFANSETRLAEPAWRFKLDDPRYFTLFEPFAFLTLTHRDSGSWEFQALRSYQRLERAHLNDDRPDALVDVTLQRLAFVRAHSTLGTSDTLYIEALSSLRDRLPNNACWAEVTHAMALWHREQGTRYMRHAGDSWKWENRMARTMCDEAIARFPGSFGARRCMQLKAQIEHPALWIEVEDAVAPDLDFMIAAHYCNVRRVGLRVVRLSPDDDLDRQEPEKWLLGMKAVKEWSIELPDDGDLNAHLVELPVAGLPLGTYAIVVARDAVFRAEQGAVAYALFTSTGLSVTQRTWNGRTELVVLDRWSGTPRAGVTVDRWTRQEDKDVRYGEATTDVEGRAEFPVMGDGVRVHYILHQGADRYRTSMGWVHVERSNVQEEVRTFLFTDRAIYRPGQEVLYKGIMITRTRKASSVKAGHHTVIRFYDVNGQLVDTANVTTDAFGAFHGKFTAPAGALTGGMRLEEANGSAYVQVEEYKRPTFEVVFDPVAGTPWLGTMVTLTATAKSYAGVPLDGATVRWKVDRSAFMPWWCRVWRSLPWGRDTEVASGTATCDAQGRFTVSFQADPDAAFPEGADPTFHFTVSADATDIGGEMQSGSTGFSLAYRSIDIELLVDDALHRATTDSIAVRVKDLLGEEVDIPVDVRIVELVPPVDAPRRPRLWDPPDRILEGELATTHLADDPMSWPVAEVVFEQREHRAKAQVLQVKGMGTFDVGMYRIEAEAMDPQGRMVKVARLVTLYDTAIQNTGFVDEAFHVEAVKARCEPGGKAALLLSSALPAGRILMEVERDGRIAASRSFTLNRTQQLIELPVLEADRGGFAVHFLCVERGRSHRQTIWIDVPWTNKELQVEWMSFRDKLLPGSREEWRLRISGPRKEKVAAQLLTVMYDASLDHFVPLAWPMFQWPANTACRSWQRSEPFDVQRGHLWNMGIELPPDTVRLYPGLWSPPFTTYYQGGVRWDGDPFHVAYMSEAPAGANERTEKAGSTGMPDADLPAGDADSDVIDRPVKQGDVVQPVRTDFRETAYFLPDLLTDRDGSVVLRFTTPDALTRWKVMGLAHTRELETAQFTRQVIASKPLMVVPNLPRFLRQGDRITLTAKINATEAVVKGGARLLLFDPVSGREVTERFTQERIQQAFTAAPGASATASWTITVPNDIDVAGVRIVANAAGISDGEEHLLPVLTDKVLVTESLPLPVNRSGPKTFTLEKLVNATSTTVQHRVLKLEFTPNPAWYAVQALPYLMEYPHECAEQIFSRYYANRLASHIVDQRPVVRSLFEEWRKHGEGAFMSALEKNAGLKSVVLEETPWVLDAKDQGERKRRVALLFDMQRMAAEEQATLDELRDMQLPGGAWPWWSGMHESRYITQHIIAGFGHLESLKVAVTRGDGPNETMLARAVEWLDAEVDRSHRELLGRTSPEEREKYVPDALDVHLLYARSFHQRWPIDGATRTAIDFLSARCKDTWVQRSVQEQALLALAFARLGDTGTAHRILGSLSERATRSEELGIYWKEFNAGARWNEFAAETHALLIEAYHEVAKDKAIVEGLRQHLLTLKRSTDWQTTKATAEACHALLLTDDDQLASDAATVIKVGHVIAKPDAAEARTGYIEQSWEGNAIKPGMGRVVVTSAKDGVQWGALHWQYLEQMDKVTPHESPFSLRKQVWLKQPTDAGARPVETDARTPLRPGDRVTIRIELRTDRHLDFVHLKDQRASALEPVEAISGYKWQGGLGYYQGIKDAAMHFFFDHIVPGTYVLEYELKVTHAGDMSNGITSAMCMYAPEFSSHSAGTRITVLPRPPANP